MPLSSSTTPGPPRPPARLGAGAIVPPDAAGLVFFPFLLTGAWGAGPPRSVGTTRRPPVGGSVIATAVDHGDRLHAGQDRPVGRRPLSIGPARSSGPVTAWRQLGGVPMPRHVLGLARADPTDSRCFLPRLPLGIALIRPPLAATAVPPGPDRCFARCRDATGGNHRRLGTPICRRPLESVLTPSRDRSTRRSPSSWRSSRPMPSSRPAAKRRLGPVRT